MTITEILSSPFLREIVLRATVVGVLVSVCASLLGVCLVMKRYSMIGDGLSHVGYFALALGALAGVGAEFSTEAAMPIVILAAILILKLDGKGKISGDAACAIVATGSVALGTIIFGIFEGIYSAGKLIAQKLNIYLAAALICKVIINFDCTTCISTFFYNTISWNFFWNCCCSSKIYTC